MNVITLKSPLFYKFEHNLTFKNFPYVKEYLTCKRPCSSESCPDIRINNHESKIIISNFGHMGVGWTTCWGSSDVAIQLYLKNNSFQKNSIIIIGSGIIGLTTACLLIEKYHVDPTKIKIVAKSLDIFETTSYKSGAMFSCLMKNSNAREDINELILETFEYWNRIYLKNSNFKLDFDKISEYIRLLDYYIGSDTNENTIGLINSNTGTEPVIEKGLLPKIELVNVAFSNNKDKIIQLKKTKTFHFNTHSILLGIIQLLKEAGVSFEKKEVKGLNGLKEIDSRIIFNCGGSEAGDIFIGWNENLKAENFNEKYYSYSAVGHMMNIDKLYYRNNEYPDYIIGSNYRVSPNDIRYFAYLPKYDKHSYGTFGSSFIKYYAGGDDERDLKEFNIIYKNMVNVFGSTNLIKTKSIKF